MEFLLATLFAYNAMALSKSAVITFTPPPLNLTDEQVKRFEEIWQTEGDEDMQGRSYVAPEHQHDDEALLLYRRWRTQTKTQPKIEAIYNRE